jgi:hypothetical protein
MKKLFFILISFVIQTFSFVIPIFSFVIPTIGGILTTTTASAQTDSLRYTQESGTLQEQRFIDRYDYVFMTKEPTKWMVRTGFLNSRTYGGLLAGFEYKLSPSFSVGGGTFFKSVSSLSGTNAGWFGEMRYYYNMKKRMLEGKSANNFSGNYFGVVYSSLFKQVRSPVPYFSRIDFPPTLPFTNALEVRWGMQRRFFNHGIVDFGVSGGLRNGLEAGRFKIAEYMIQTNWSTGLAFGDFKRKKLPPLCDVLKCYDTQKSLWKLAWPDIFIGYNSQSVSTSLAYERQIGSSAFSLNIQNNSSFINQYNGTSVMPITETKIINGQPVIEIVGTESIDNTRFTINSITYLQPRFYLGRQKLSQRSYNAASLSGAYLGISLIHAYERMKNNQFYGARNFVRYHAFELGPSAGYQQKIFKNGYLDFGLTVGTPIQRYDSNRLIGGVLTFRPSFKLGFAF